MGDLLFTFYQNLRFKQLMSSFENTLEVARLTEKVKALMKQEIGALKEGEGEGEGDGKGDELGQQAHAAGQDPTPKDEGREEE